MDNRDVVYTIKDGQLEILTEGFKGVGCAALQDKLMKEIGGRVVSERPTDDFYVGGDPNNANGLTTCA